jgi:hypothetical protein
MYGPILRKMHPINNRHAISEGIFELLGGFALTKYNHNYNFLRIFYMLDTVLRLYGYHHTIWHGLFSPAGKNN